MSQFYIQYPLRYRGNNDYWYHKFSEKTGLLLDKSVDSYINSKKTPIFYGVLGVNGPLIKSMISNQLDFVYIDNAYNLTKSSRDKYYRVHRGNLFQSFGSIAPLSIESSKGFTRDIELYPGGAAFEFMLDQYNWHNQVINSMKLIDRNFVFHVNRKKNWRRAVLTVDRDLTRLELEKLGRVSKFFNGIKGKLDKGSPRDATKIVFSSIGLIIELWKKGHHVSVSKSCALWSTVPEEYKMDVGISQPILPDRCSLLSLEEHIQEEEISATDMFKEVFWQ